MMLVECPECWHLVSDQADACPACGHPIKRGSLPRAGTSRTFNVGCLVTLLVALVLFGMCSRF
jgi:hypothetical protein